MQLTLDYLKASNGSANASLMTVQSVRAPGATTISVNTVAGVPTNFMATMGEPHTFVDPVTGETITIISEATAVDFSGHVDSGQLEIDEIAPGYLDTRGSEVGDIVIIRPTTQWADLIAQFLTPTGVVSPFAGSVAPEYWLLCDGASVERDDYPRLFDVIGTTYGSVDGSHFNLPDLRDRDPIGAGTAPTKVASFASRSGNVLTLTGLSNTAQNEFQTGQEVVYNVTGTTIGGLTNATTYYLIRTGNTTFSLATSRANALAGTAITLSADGSGTRIFTLTLSARTLGETGGEEAHSSTVAESAAHSHPVSYGGAVAVNNGSQVGVRGDGANNTGSTGGNLPHNNMQPFLALNYIIKT